MKDETKVVWHDHSVSREDRERLNGHGGCVVWFTGLSGCGKSTIANCVDQKLHAMAVRTCLLDGDNIRHSLNASPAKLAESYGQAFAERFGLGFGEDDRMENIRRVGAVAQLFCSTGIIALIALVSPYRRDRDAARAHVEKCGYVGDFIEVFVDAPLSVCEARDPKGLYKQARAGQIKNFTGIDAPYEPPISPELKLEATDKSPEQLADKLIDYLRVNGKIS